VVHAHQLLYSKYEVSASIWELFPQLEDLRIFILYKANVKRRMNTDDAGGNELNARLSQI